jgi:hypothetical protein
VYKNGLFYSNIIIYTEGFFMIKNRLIITGLLLSVVCITGCKEEYSAPELKRVRDLIKETYINIDSIKVAKKVKKGVPLSGEFQEYLDENPYIQEMRRMKASGTSLSVTSVVEDIGKDFDHKHHELKKDIKASVQKEMWGKIFVGLGALAVVGGGCMMTDRSMRGVGGLVAGTGAVGVVGGGLTWYWSLDTQMQKEVHNTENIIMKEKIENVFYERSKKQQKADEQ